MNQLPLDSRQGDASELLDLFGMVGDETATTEQVQRLEGLLRIDHNVVASFVRFMFLHALLERNFEIVRPHIVSPLPYAVQFEPAEEPTLISAPTVLSTAFHGTIGYFSHEMPFSFLVGAALTSLLVLIAWLVPVSSPVEIANNKSSIPLVAQRQFTPESKMEIVGRITGMADVKWADINASTETGNGVLLGRKYVLSSGLMEITYDTGAKVILQGPVTYEVESKNGGFLPIGKLTGKVENEAARGFSVRTPTATVTDLSTEFGVEVSKEGNTTSHVFRGSVEIQAIAADGKKEGNAQVLRENQLARVEKNSGNRITVIVKPAKPADFVRKIPHDNLKPTVKILDLVDVVAGGDGFSGRRNRGIDSSTGETVTKAPSDEELTPNDEKYHRVPKLPYVDGVFIPDGLRGPCQTDSAGHKFEWFSNSTHSMTHCVWAGGTIPSLAVVPTDLGGIDYASAGHGMIFLHANKGVTFSLEAIRRAHPKFKIQRFLAVAGNLENNSANNGFFDSRRHLGIGRWPVAFPAARHQSQQRSFSDGYSHRSQRPLFDVGVHRRRR